MSAERPSLEAQAARYRELILAPEYEQAHQMALDLVIFCKRHGLRVEIESRPNCWPPRMGATLSHITVTPSREGYQSTN